MGIENNTREIEVQNQELQRANREQIEQANQEHEELGKVLDGLDTLDNEAELDEISGNEDISEQDDTASQLDKNDKIEDEPSEQLETINNPVYNEAENNGFSINDVNQAVDAKEAYEAEIRDMSQDEYHNQKELDQRVEENGSEPNMIEPSVLGNDLHQGDVSNKETDKRSRLNEPEQNAVDMERSTEETLGNDEVDDSLSDVSTVDESNGQEVKLPELPDNVQESYRKYESDPENLENDNELDVQNPENAENPSDVDKEKNENREGELWSEQGKMAKDAFDSAEAPLEKDKYGNDYKPLTREEAQELSDKLKSQIDSVPKGEGGNYRVPETEKIKGVSVNDKGETRVVENWRDGTDGAKPGTRHMETVKATGEDGKPTVIDRIGGENGNYFAPMNSDGEPYSLKERATGDYLPNENIQDNDSYHPYEVKQDFTRENFEKAINDTYDDPDVREDKMDALNAYYNDATSDSYTNGHDGEKYCDCTPDQADGVKTGEIDQMFLHDGDEYGKGTDGGGQQYITPFSAKELQEMGMIEEIRR